MIKRCLICGKTIWSILWIGYDERELDSCTYYEYRIPGAPYKRFMIGEKKKKVFAHNKCVKEKGEKRID